LPVINDLQPRCKSSEKRPLYRPKLCHLLGSWGDRLLAAVRSAPSASLLHALGHTLRELVHVEQYRQLGIPSFAELYVRGFLNGGGYDGIPLKVNAYELGDRFEGNPRTRFSVANEVSE
jgi:hypothetical protein